MRRIEFKLNVKKLDIHHAPTPPALSVDGVTGRGRAYRAEILIQPHTAKLDEREQSELKNVVKELIKMLVSANISAHDVNDMTYAVAL